MAKKESVATTPLTKTAEKKGCGCNGHHGTEYEAPEPYTHEGKEYLFKAFVIFERGEKLPAKQVFKLAAGEQLCEDCLADYPVLASVIDENRMDNGTAKSIVDRLFTIGSPLLSVIE
jgi:hypothetical protein